YLSLNNNSYINLILMIFHTILFYLFSMIYTSRLKTNQNNNVAACSPVNNCFSYQVFSNYTNYGCRVCQKEFALTAMNSTLIGTCDVKSTIQNCLITELEDANDN